MSQNYDFQIARANDAAIEAEAASLEHFPSILTHPDCPEQPRGEEEPEGRAGCPDEGDDAATGLLRATPVGRAPFGPLQRRRSWKYRHIPALRLLAEGQNRLRRGGSEWAERALDNARQRALRSEKAWREMAERTLKLERERENARVERAVAAGFTNAHLV